MPRAQPNPFIGRVYIPDNVKMEEPPAWFLQRFFDFDAMLVILPSRQRPFHYVIARRKQLSAGLTDRALEETVTDSDTKMCLKYGVVPVTLMFKHGPVWNADKILATLAARDLWAHGGADKAADALEAQEAAEKAATRAQVREDMYHRSGDAWRSYQLRTGAAVGYRAGARSGTAQEKQSPSGSTAGSGVMFSND